MLSTPEGFRTLVNNYSQPLYWHVRRLVVSHDDAQDVLQETFMKVYKSLPTLREIASLKAWLYRIATNEAMRMLGRNAPPSCSIDDAGADLLALKADDYTDYTHLEAVRLQQAINSLPAKQRVAFNLRYYDDMSYEDIAQVTDSTPSNVKVNYHLAKNKIIKYLDSHD